MNRTVLAIGLLAASTAMLVTIGCCGQPCPLLAPPKKVPAIHLTKDAPHRAETGQQFNYSIRVTNPGSAAARNVVLTDTLPSGIQHVSSAPEATVQGQTLRWNLGELSPGQSRTIKIRVQANQSGKFCNTAQVTADEGLKDNAKACTVVSRAALSIQKIAPQEVLTCEPIHCKVVITNTGDGPAHHVKFVDSLPEGLVVRREKELQKDWGTLKPGHSKEVSFDVMATRPGTYVNRVTVTADGGLRAEAQASTVVRQPVLAVVKKGPERRYANRDIPYGITVTNQGDGLARGVTLTDTLPAGVSLVAAGEGGRARGGQIVWSLGDLLPGASKAVSVTLKASTPGVVVNTATATAMCAEASAQARTEIAGVPAILLENWDSPDPIEVGAQTTYSIRITNQGSAEDKNVVVTCLLPPEETFVSANGPTPHAVEGQKVTFAPVAAMAPKEVDLYTVVVKGVKAGDARFRVSLTSDMMTSPAEKSESTHIYGD